MNITSRYTSRNHLPLAILAFALSLGGCWEVTPEPGDIGTDAGAGASSAGSGNAAIGGATNGGRAQSEGGAAAGGDASSGGNTQAGGSLASSGGTPSMDNGGSPPAGGSTVSNESGGSPASGGTLSLGGAAPSGGAAQSGGNAQLGGSTQGAQSGGSPASGGTAPSGGSTQAPQNGGSPASGGVPASGGSSTGSSAGGTAPSGGTTAVGGAAQAGSGGGTQVLESICVDEAGGAVPYDYSFGLVSEYAFELSMSCDVGGYLMPLVLADPEQLSQVNAFVAEATDWYRAEILKCGDATTQLGQNEYGLLPVSQSSELSAADFDSSMALFTMVIDRHDTQPDAVSATKKAKIKDRIKSVKARAVHNSTGGLTKTLTEPDCVPAEPSGS